MGNIKRKITVTRDLKKKADNELDRFGIDRNIKEDESGTMFFYRMILEVVSYYEALLESIPQETEVTECRRTHAN